MPVVRTYVLVGLYEKGCWSRTISTMLLSALTPHEASFLGARNISCRSVMLVSMTVCQWRLTSCAASSSWISRPVRICSRSSTVDRTVHIAASHCLGVVHAAPWSPDCTESGSPPVVSASCACTIASSCMRCCASSLVSVPANTASRSSCETATAGGAGGFFCDGTDVTGLSSVCGDNVSER